MQDLYTLIDKRVRMIANGIDCNVSFNNVIGLVLNSTANNIKVLIEEGYRKNDVISFTISDNLWSFKEIVSDWDT